MPVPELDAIGSYYGRVTGYVTAKYQQVKKSLQDEIAETITDLVEKVMRPTLLNYIQGTYHLKDGSVVHGQSAFDRMVSEDKDIVALIEMYRPSYMRYLDQARKVRDFVKWDSERFADNLAGFLGEHGIEVTPRGRAYLVRTCERFRKRIYG